MNHVWKDTDPKTMSVSHVCEKCGVTKSPYFYGNLPGGLVGKSQQVISIDSGEPDCDLMLFQHVMFS